MLTCELSRKNANSSKVVLAIIGVISGVLCGLVLLGISLIAKGEWSVGKTE